MASLVERGRWRTWLPPALLALALAAVLVGQLNRPVLLALNHFGAATAPALWANVTALGDSVVAVALLLPLWRRRPELIWAAALVIVIAAALVHIPKPLINEARPPAVLGDALEVIGRAYRNRSFPSGHAATAFALAGLIALGGGWRAAYWPSLLLAALVAVSRCVVGVHWPVDVLSGAIIGWCSAWAGLALARRYPRPAASPWLQWIMGALLAGCALALLAGFDADYPQARWLLGALGLATFASALLALRPQRR